MLTEFIMALAVALVAHAIVWAVGWVIRAAFKRQ